MRYFLIKTQTCQYAYYHDEVLAYNTTLKNLHKQIPQYKLNSGRWDSIYYEAVEVDGTVFCCYQNDWKHIGLYNICTNIWHKILPPPLTTNWNYPYYHTLFGMVVDINATPHTFQLILGDSDFKTHIYDSTSNLWTIKSSDTLETQELWMAFIKTDRGSCVHANGCVYINILFFPLIKIIQNNSSAFNWERDFWKTKKGPPQNDYDYNVHTLGM